MPRDASGGRPARGHRIQPLAQAKVGGINEKSRWNQLLKQTSDLLLRSAHTHRADRREHRVSTHTEEFYKLQA